MQPIEKIQFFFRNYIADHVLQSGDYDSENLRRKFLTAIHACIRNVLRASDQQDGIVLNDFVVTLDNCPVEYHELFQALLALKAAEHSSEQIGYLALQVVNSNLFASLNLANIFQIENTSLTIEEIRNSFYEAMTSVAFDGMDSNLFSVEDFEDENPKLYEALPALTLIAAIEHSKNDGANIRLLNGKLFNVETCPKQPTFQALLTGILAMKSVIEQLTEPQMAVLKHKLTSDEELPAQYQGVCTPELMGILARLASKATDIAREPVFNRMVRDIFKVIAPEENPAPQ